MPHDADAALIAFLLLDDDHDDSKNNEYKPYILSGKSNPKPFSESLVNSPIFEPMLGVTEDRFRLIHDGICVQILKPRHHYFLDLLQYLKHYLHIYQYQCDIC